MEKQLILQTAKRAANWTIPPGVQTFVRSYLRRSCALFGTRLNPAEKALLEKNRELYNRHAGERCFILATGPSITELDLTLLKGEVCISMSSFFVHRDFCQIRPKYHCIAPLHSPFTYQDSMQWFRKMEPYMENTTLILSSSDKQLVDSSGIFCNNPVHFLSWGDNWSNLSNKKFDLTRPLPGCQSATLIALMVALYVGCQEIYLLGVDQNVPFIPQTRQLQRARHFFDELVTNPLGTEPRSDLETVLSIAIRLYEQYVRIKMYANNNGVVICNATHGGKMEVFPRVRYEKLFK